MTNNYFKEQIKKNNVLDNYSNKFDILFIKNFQGSQDISFNVSSSTFCNLYIKIKSIDGEMIIKLNSNILIKIYEDNEYFLPLKLFKVNTISINGKCEKLLLKLQGGIFDYYNNRTILPKNNKILNNVGDLNLFSYLDYQDIFNNNLTKDTTFTNVIFMQTYISDGNTYLGKLVNNSALYFYNSTDNYTSGVNISDENISSAIFIQDYKNSCLYFVYIKDNKVFYKTLKTGQELGGELELNTGINKLPISIIGAQTYIDGSKFFAIINEKNIIDIYYAKYNAQFQKVCEYRGKNIKIIEKDNEVIFLIFNDYQV
ncbi:MAG: hypothetical protein ACI4PF_03275, partial [Christensenellales bacterium]